MIKVLVVDDSVVFRTVISEALKGHPSIEVVATASNGQLALKRIEQMPVDVMTLDIEMPEMDGIEVLREINKRGLNTKTIIFSSQTIKGAEKGLAALKEGAMDIVAKPDGGENGLINPPVDKIREILVPKILQFQTGDKKGVLTHAQVHAPQAKKSLEGFSPSIIVIASSTGGPAALEKIFSRIKPPLRIPIMIAQHMPRVFTEIFARRLGEISGITCKEAKDDEPILPGTIYIAPGDYHLTIVGSKDAPKVELTQAAPRNFVRPSADYLFESSVEIFGKNTFAVVLTGMGEDGLCGARAVRKLNGRVLIQNRESSVVFGMPGSLFQDDCYDAIGDLDTIGSVIERMVKVS